MGTIHLNVLLIEDDAQEQQLFQSMFAQANERNNDRVHYSVTGVMKPTAASKTRLVAMRSALVSCTRSPHARGSGT